MKIILNQDVVNLGEEGDVVVVKSGYARNYLLPNKMAVMFNKTNQAIFASRTAAIEKRKEEKRAASAGLKEKLDNVVITMVVSAGESGKLFGSVTSAMVQEALAKQGIEIERKKIEVPTHSIKMVGTYSVRVHLYEDVSAEIKLIVESENVLKKRQADEAKAKAEADKAEAAKAAQEAKAAKVAKEAEEAEAAAKEAEEAVIEEAEAEKVEE
ncbi:50S ribosomal protein L9 [Sphaerochaeta halotolerans]|jgi:large subunit ribosomal protein L9|uniref:Large ribosomal subunit protein bL9 n=1 Tax=Sphaerochaeta halotolerans TaxID=2293840 RepID=A0A372MFI1_9SPIR|nr:50S ribosomal protein L9 [Sphaerochaeta halotolerans]MBG0767073.1 50S ribosomal protein L9 [Spirochaetaceae bacterium]MDK2858906.1 large subunit ribosomal protein [Sphaerochaeta sp.]MDN5332930.1 large subunit ribosomal protein [Sphaerochaeta sp.]MXI87439.1 50S ribosomal protein L9 [Sphaerochaeta halotolerans]RFU94148.1 50S ribosomal protein L9 [Sphaerochaeta halotolerans]